MEVNFCPFCDAPQHKILSHDSLMFCKECKNFFRLEEVKLKCLKCKSTDVVNSDFPSPSGEVVFQCNKCRKMYSAKELLDFNKIS